MLWQDEILIGVTEAAKRLNMSARLLRELAKQNKIRSVKLRRGERIEHWYREFDVTFYGHMRPLQLLTENALHGPTIIRRRQAH